MATFTNQATLSYNGNTVNSNIVSGNIIEVLSVTKTALRDEYTANGSVTYIVSLTNSGSAPFTGITVTDNLGAYVPDTATLIPLSYIADSVAYYQNGVLQSGLTLVSEQPLSFSGITVPANGNAMLIYEAKANEFAPLSAQSTITNEVSVTAPSISTPLTAQASVTVSEEPILSISKGLSPTTVTANSEITYTFILQNSGNTAALAADNIVIADTFDPILSNISVAVNGTTLPVASYTYNETTGEFSTTAGAISVPAATYGRTTDGRVTVTPGVTTVTITGTI